jgi:Protein of unknown function (DUF2630)
VATDEQIRNRIEELVSEEHKLWEAESRGEVTEGDRRRPPFYGGTRRSAPTGPLEKDSVN